jgi:hypothetical protein
LPDLGDQKAEPIQASGSSDNLICIVISRAISLAVVSRAEVKARFSLSHGGRAISL